MNNVLYFKLHVTAHFNSRSNGEIWSSSLWLKNLKKEIYYRILLPLLVLQRTTTRNWHIRGICWWARRSQYGIFLLAEIVRAMVLPVIPSEGFHFTVRHKNWTFHYEHELTISPRSSVIRIYEGILSFLIKRAGLSKLFPLRATLEGLKNTKEWRFYFPHDIFHKFIGVRPPYN